VIARADKEECGQRPGLFATAKDPLVQSDEERVENGAVGVQEFIEEDERCLGKHTFGVRQEFALAQLPNVKGAEEFAGFGEAGEEIVEGAAFHPGGELVNKSGFGGSRWPEEEEVLAANEADAEQIDDLVLADEGAFHRVEDLVGKAGGDFDGGHWLKR